jgi:hypothetical protein
MPTAHATNLLTTTRGTTTKRRLLLRCQNSADPRYGAAGGRTSWTGKAAERQYLISYENALLDYVFRLSWMPTSPYKTRDQSKAECKVRPSQQVKRSNDFTGFELAYTSARLRQACPDHHTDCRDCGSCRESRCGRVRVLSLSLSVLANTSTLLSRTDPRTALTLQC